MADKKEQLIGIVGPDHVIDNSDILSAYSEDNSFTPHRKPSLVVRPKDVGQVQEIVQWANQTRTPLVPVSSGAPHFRGDTVPVTEGSVIVDLSSMKKIIRIDRRNRIAIIEPGVTYDELQPALAKEGMRITMPLMPRGNKSVVTSLLEREPLTTAKYQWSLMEPLRTMEVIWGDGSKFWTGESGEYVQNLDEQYKNNRAAVVGMGPGPVDYYRLISGAQGTMAIVTWASVKCEVLPRVHKLYFISANKLEDLIDCAYDIVRIRFGDEQFIVNGSGLAYMLGKVPDEIQALKKQLPPWILLLGIAGRDYLPEERVAFQEKDISDIVRKHSLEMLTDIPAAKGEDVLKLLNSPCAEPYWKLRYKGKNQDIFFMTTLDKTVDFTKTMLSAAEPLDYAAPDVGVYIQPQHQGASCHCEFSLPYRSEDAEIVKKVYEAASEALLKQGAYFSRPYGVWADMVYKDEVQNTKMLKKVKKLFDPNDILNPGKLCFERRNG